jgi:ferritin-like metal-binding protein YciE
MALATMHDLMVAELKDLYSAETQLVMALPRMATGSVTPRLRKAFTHQLDETHDHVMRLAQVFRILGESARGPKCDGMAALVADAVAMIDADGHDVVRDAGISAAAQRINHYEIAAYGSTLAFARILERNDIAGLLEQTLSEVKVSYELLLEIADDDVNVNAPRFTEEVDEDAAEAWLRPQKRGTAVRA